MSKVDINVKISTGKFRLATINNNFLDGSIYLTLVRENENTSGFSQSINISDTSLSCPDKIEEVSKIIKISCHTSGVIKYHNLSVDRIFNEPLYDITEPFLIIEYLVKDLNRLLTSSEQENVIELPEKEEDKFYSFSFFICREPMEEALVLSYYDGLFFLCMKVNLVKGINGNKEMPFYYLTPSNGKVAQKQSEGACVLFHQKVNDTDGVITYKPNRSGVYTMIFHETRRSIPRSEKLIKFINPEYIAKFTSVKSHYAKFFVRNSRNGDKIIETSNLIEQIVFDNRL